ncbi:MAG: hypothetical protein AAFW73_24455 [Bacteroidota bacterium]
MKYFQFFVLSALLLLPGLLLAQAVPRVEAPSPEALAVDAAPARLLPAKQVSLLYEIEASEMDKFDEQQVTDELMADGSVDQTYRLRVLLHLFSTVNVAKIHVNIGTSPGGADVASHQFNFDELTGEGATFSYARDGKTIVLGMGQVRVPSGYYAQVVLEAADGQRSEARYVGPQQ